MYTHSSVHLCACFMRAYMHMCVRTCVRACTCACVRACVHARVTVRSSSWSSASKSASARSNPLSACARMHARARACARMHGTEGFGCSVQHHVCCRNYPAHRPCARVCACVHACERGRAIERACLCAPFAGRSLVLAYSVEHRPEPPRLCACVRACMRVCVRACVHACVRTECSSSSTRKRH